MPTTPAVPKQAHAGVTLKLAAENPTLAPELLRRLVGWKNRTGATITIGTPADADIVVVPSTDLGRWFDGTAAEVSETIRNSNHPLGWSRCLPVYSERLVRWNGVPSAVPLAGDGFVLIYRPERLTDPALLAAYQAKFQRVISTPTTWEDIAEISEVIASRGGTALPAMTADLREFQMLAACYDRSALSATTLVALQKSAPESVPTPDQLFAFYHDLQTGQPRIAAPSFVAAAAWLQRVQPYRLTNALSAAEAVANSTAVFGIASLAELGRLPKDANGAVLADMTILPLPGTREWFDASGQRKPAVEGGKTSNFVPIYGLGSWFAVVRSKCVAQEAAFDALAELASLSKSVDMLSDPALGFGPFRTEHLEQTRQGVYARYGFDGARTQQLAEAVRLSAGASLANPAFVLRGSDSATLLANLSSELQKCVRGTSPTEAMKAVETSWKALDAKRPPDVVRTERRYAAGLR